MLTDTAPEGYVPKTLDYPKDYHSHEGFIYPGDILVYWEHDPVFGLEWTGTGWIRWE